MTLSEAIRIAETAVVWTQEVSDAHYTLMEDRANLPCTNMKHSALLDRIEALPTESELLRAYGFQGATESQPDGKKGLRSEV